MRSERARPPKGGRVALSPLTSHHLALLTSSMRRRLGTRSPPSTNRMTIFGGTTSVSNLNDVWVLSGANGASGTPMWTQLAPTGTAPSPINSFSAVYDPGTNRMIIFGGNDGVTAFNNVWVLTRANGQ